MTEDENTLDPEMIRVHSREEFLSLAVCGRHSDPKRPLSPLQRFYGGIYSELFEDTRHLFNRYLMLLEDKTRIKERVQVTARIDTKLAAFSHDTDKSLPHVEARLNSFYREDVAAAVFVLGSINQTSSLCLDRVFQLFPLSEKEYRQAFVMGLKHGKHSGITPFLETMSDMWGQTETSDVSDIITFRKQRSNHVDHREQNTV